MLKFVLLSAIVALALAQTCTPPISKDLVGDFAFLPNAAGLLEDAHTKYKEICSEFEGTLPEPVSCCSTQALDWIHSKMLEIRNQQPIEVASLSDANVAQIESVFNGVLDNFNVPGLEQLKEAMQRIFGLIRTLLSEVSSYVKNNLNGGLSSCAEAVGSYVKVIGCLGCNVNWNRLSRVEDAQKQWIVKFSKRSCSRVMSDCRDPIDNMGQGMIEIVGRWMNQFNDAMGGLAQGSSGFNGFPTEDMSNKLKENFCPGGDCERGYCKDLVGSGLASPFAKMGALNRAMSDAADAAGNSFAGAFSQLSSLLSGFGNLGNLGKRDIPAEHQEAVRKAFTTAAKAIDNMVLEVQASSKAVKETRVAAKRHLEQTSGNSFVAEYEADDSCEAAGTCVAPLDTAGSTVVPLMFTVVACLMVVMF